MPKTSRTLVLTGLLLTAATLFAPVTLATDATNSANKSTSRLALVSPTPTPSPSASPDNSEETTQKLRERIEKIVEEKKDQVKGVINEIAQRRRGFIGEVQRVSAEGITVKTNKGTQILALNSDVELTRKGKAISLDDIAVGDWVIVIGSTDQGTFTPIHIMVVSASLRPTSRTLILGSIDALTKTQLTILPRTGGDTIQVTLTKTTQYQDINGDKIPFSAISTDMQALVLAWDKDDGPKEAKIVRILTVQPTPTPSPSPTSKKK